MKRTTSILALVTALSLGGASTGALAAGGGAADTEAGVKNTNLQLIWGLYLGGIALGKIGFNTTIDGPTYSAYSQLETQGIVNSFWESRIRADSTGEVREMRLVPKAYNSDYVSARSTQIVNLGYVDGFPARLTAEPEYDLKRFPVPDADKDGTVDPLSAMVYAVAGVTASEGAPCGTEIPVFDGRRRYNINLDYLQTVAVDHEDYKGGALECTMEYEQIAGFKPNLDPDKRPFPTIHAILAPVERIDAPGMLAYIPLKVWAETAFGVAVANARHVTVNNAKPVPALAAPQTAER
ncbi:MAG: DUF3108 domain-containing protein [Alphaproteobacteria bacterium]|nr:DUF3108 domain-containing protein [Alphaproteobacteria bacterium]